MKLTFSWKRVAVLALAGRADDFRSGAGHNSHRVQLDVRRHELTGHLLGDHYLQSDLRCWSTMEP